jgi:LPS sulfotransferase NodH
MPAHRFVVLSSQRTGSTLLVRSLDSVPEIFCAGEIFHFGKHTHHREFQYPYLKPGKNALARAAAVLLQKRRLERHLAYFYGRAGEGVCAVGFKLMVSQAGRYPAIVGWLRRHSLTAIVLYRRNTFDATLSYCMARMTGRYHSDRAESQAKAEPVTIDETEFAHCFDSCAADRERLLELHRSLGGVLVAYEDMVRDWDRTIATIGEHLGLSRLRVPMSLERISGSAGTEIANEGELRARYSGREAES